MTNKVRWFLPLAIIITGLSCVIYGAVQQAIRLGANDVLVQTSIDVQQLSQQSNWEQLLGSRTIDISKNLDTYIIAYSTDGKPTVGNARLDGVIPEMPDGLLDYTSKHGGQHYVTWQPRPNARQAIFLQELPDKTFLVTGRSLREVEKLESSIAYRVLVGWIVTMAATFVAVLLLPLKKTK